MHIHEKLAIYLEILLLYANANTHKNVDLEFIHRKKFI